MTSYVFHSLIGPDEIKNVSFTNDINTADDCVILRTNTKKFRTDDPHNNNTWIDIEEI
jgi:hypothetical protein